MCAPEHFGVDYVINAWMTGNLGKADRPLAHKQWDNLKAELAAHADLIFIEPQPRLADMVFTANAGMVVGTVAIASRFRDSERQGEEPFFSVWFAKNGFELAEWPAGLFFEGAGDALLDRGQPLVWAGHGFRSDPRAAPLIEEIFGIRTVGLKLVDPRFYHLDTCLCPLEGGHLLYYPPAFDADSQKKIAELVPAEKRIVPEEEDALKFACNAVDVNRHVFTNAASKGLQEKLRAAGFTPIITPLSEFLKAGGGAKCLTLKLHEPS